MGRPIEIASQASPRATVDHTVVSVGPYIFHSARTRGSNASTSSRERASPPQSAMREGLPSHPSESNMRQVAGVACMSVAPLSISRACKARAPGMTVDDVMLAVTTLSFVIAVLELLLPLTVGASTVIASRETSSDARALQALLIESGATLMQATPATWRMLLSDGWEGSPSLIALCGGEALSRELVDALLPRVRALWNMYGPTETTVWSTVARVEACDAISIGRPIDNTQVYILDEAMQPVPPCIAGELCIACAGVALGYLHREYLTAVKFIANPFVPGARMYRTGERARGRRGGRRGGRG